MMSPTETPLVIVPDLSYDGNRHKAKPPLMDPVQVEKLNRFMFTYDPYENRRPVRINSRPYPPWAYLPDILDGRTVEFRYHPDVFKTNLCKNGAECQMRETCPFIHPGERYVPTWRNTGMFFDNIYYPPPPVTYEWFKHLMLEFKTKGPCQMKQGHDYKRCPYWHADMKVLDRRGPLQYDMDKDAFVPLPPDATPTAKQFYPYHYKRQPCKFVQKEERCIQGRYCTNDHMGPETQAIAGYIERLKHEMATEIQTKRQGKAAAAEEDGDYYANTAALGDPQGNAFAYSTGSPGAYHDCMHNSMGIERQREMGRPESKVGTKGSATPPAAMSQYDREANSFFSGNRPPGVAQACSEGPSPPTHWVQPQGFHPMHPPHVSDFGSPYPPMLQGLANFGPYGGVQGHSMYDGTLQGRAPPGMGQWTGDEYQQHIVLMPPPMGQGPPPRTSVLRPVPDAPGVREPDSAFWNFLEDNSEPGAIQAQGEGGDAFSTMAAALGSVAPFTPAPPAQAFPPASQGPPYSQLQSAEDLPPNPRQWSVSEVQRWLGSHKLEQVRQTAVVLGRHDVDGELLVTLNDNILKELGIVSWGQRRKLLRAIEEQLITMGITVNQSLPAE